MSMCRRLEGHTFGRMNGTPMASRPSQIIAQLTARLLAFSAINVSTKVSSWSSACICHCVMPEMVLKCAIFTYAWMRSALYEYSPPTLRPASIGTCCLAYASQHQKIVYGNPERDQGPIKATTASVTAFITA
jgi:hypothetical protein